MKNEPSQAHPFPNFLVCRFGPFCIEIDVNSWGDNVRDGKPSGVRYLNHLQLFPTANRGWFNSKPPELVKHQIGVLPPLCPYSLGISRSKWSRLTVGRCLGVIWGVRARGQARGRYVLAVVNNCLASSRVTIWLNFLIVVRNYNKKRSEIIWAYLKCPHAMLQGRWW